MAGHHAETAAMIVEPLVQGAAGMITAPSGYLRRVRELCSKYNILLIAGNCGSVPLAGPAGQNRVYKECN